MEPEYPHLDRALSFASSLCHQRQIDAKQFGILSDLIWAAFREGRDAEQYRQIEDRHED